jgi:hypothetical protein
LPGDEEENLDYYSAPREEGLEPGADSVTGKEDWEPGNGYCYRKFRNDKFCYRRAAMRTRSLSWSYHGRRGIEAGSC